MKLLCKLRPFFIPANVNEDNGFNDLITDIENIFIVAEFVPIFKIKPKTFSHWFSNELKPVIINKKITHKLYKRDASAFYYNKKLL